MANEPIRVLLVDDHAIARNGVRLMLGTAPDIRVDGEAGDAQEAMRRIAERSFDVALLDITMPGKSGLDLLKTLRAERPRMAVLMLSTYSEEIYAVRALRLGAAGYLTKDAPTATLVAAVRKAAAGGKHVSPALLEKLAEAIGGAGGGDHESLSNRELEVFKLIAAGESLVRIGELLHLSPNTVTTYRARILEKMGMASNADLTRYALQNGLI
ncbi:response regulator transcription factor [Pseudoduganella namucuonensis]|uniref:Two component transcriptional regulator, LuxR family n=1 Tax=Pseudoduganella namucuonensis TaxID=1035707 RepID=A0A1I7KNW8_9BURK|nr:response regulator transcription factor [Pseudoduganella namucuonensis]SFU99109.1 two component transcriptional regulator, LuxR family [Pseudoduganella namucuonensis]